MLEEEEEELDDEIVQARVDSSLAKIYSVTSAWMKPKKTPSAPKKDFEKELEEIMRRPPRLGVGAELPEKQVKSGPGELKLKNKMLGNKREREETSFSGFTDAAAPEDNEEESKSRIIKKRPRLDPFAWGKKKGKGLKVPTTSPHKLADILPGFATNPEKEEVTATTKSEGLLGPSSSKTTSTCGPNPYGDEKGKRPNAKDVVRAHKPSPSLPPVPCLHGPPTIRGDARPSSKKKRRHKKKKKHHAGGVTIAMP